VRETCARIGAGDLKGTTKLKLAGGLRCFPNEVFELRDSLEVLDLSQNSLDALPRDFGVFPRLRVFFASENQFIKFPTELAQCPALSMVGFKSNAISSVDERAFPKSLRWLILTNNRLTELPASIGRLHALEKLMLAGNALTSLPNELADCRRLSLLRISANSFSQFPKVVLELPQLAWLAIAGNPFLKQGRDMPITSLPQLKWGELTVGRLLGEGASGRIYSASRKAPDSEGNESFALKIFKSEVTSDGYARDEMRAWLSVPSHPNLVQVTGILTGHPEGCQGLAFSLIADSFSKLAEPPSFESCTRDVYSQTLSLSSETAGEIARNVAAAVSHLHTNQVMHGDLYAHNILKGAGGTCVLSDLGAAASYGACEGSLGEALARIEVAALGILLEELHKHLCVSARDEAKRGASILARLAAECQRVPARRPLPQHVLAALDGLAL
jgi:hypothetical protein